MYNTLSLGSEQHAACRNRHASVVWLSQPKLAQPFINNLTEADAGTQFEKFASRFGAATGLRAEDIDTALTQPKKVEKPPAIAILGRVLRWHIPSEQTAPTMAVAYYGNTLPNMAGGLLGADGARDGAGRAQDTCALSGERAGT